MKTPGSGFPDDMLVVHTSDLHVGSEIHGGDAAGPESLASLRAILALVHSTPSNNTAEIRRPARLASS